LGIIKPNAFADFLLLAGDPLNDVTILNRPNEYLKAVVKDGRCVRSSVGGLKVEVALL
jgi:imidazolonepropionase-like amidohydrolase